MCECVCACSLKHGPLSVRLIYVQTPTLPPGDVRSRRPALCCCTCVFVLWPSSNCRDSCEVQSAAAIQRASPSSRNPTSPNTRPVSVMPLPSFQIKHFPGNHLPPPPLHPFLDVKHLAELACDRLEKLTQQCLSRNKLACVRSAHEEMSLRPTEMVGAN